MVLLFLSQWMQKSMSWDFVSCNEFHFMIAQPCLSTRWCIAHNNVTNLWYFFQQPRLTGTVLCSRKHVTFLSSISLISRIQFMPYSASWQVVWESEILTKMNEYNPSWEAWFSAALTDWQGGSFPLAPGEDLGIQPLSDQARVWWPLGAMLYTNLTCMQGMSARPCWPDSVLAVTHLLPRLP